MGPRRDCRRAARGFSSPDRAGVVPQRRPRCNAFAKSPLVRNCRSQRSPLARIRRGTFLCVGVSASTGTPFPINCKGDTTIRPILATTIAAALLGAPWIPIASAQTPSPPTVGAPREASPYSDSELKSFALAALSVQRIRNQYLPKLEAAQTPEQEQAVRKAAADEMTRAIEGEGITVRQYTEISNQARQSPELAKRVEDQIRGATSK